MDSGVGHKISRMAECRCHEKEDNAASPLSSYSLIIIVSNLSHFLFPNDNDNANNHFRDDFLTTKF